MVDKGLHLVRRCLCGAIVWVSIACAPPAPQGQHLADADRMLARAILEELVGLRTTENEGTRQAAEVLAKRLLAAGFQQSDVEVAGPSDRIAGLIARYGGRDSSLRPIVLMAHLDVVPASREDWSVDPWTLVERDGWLYGRGTRDNKAGAAMLVANFIRLKREGWQPARDVVVLLTADEETAQSSIRWMLSERKWLANAEMAFNTDGGALVLRGTRPLFFDLQVSEKIYADYELEVTDAGGHSSLVRPDNPIYHLSAALIRLAQHEFPLHLTDQTRLFFERSAPLENGQTAADMRAVAAAKPDLAAAARLSRSPFYNSRLRTTCVATRVDAGHANNALPQRARAVVNCRIMPGEAGSEVEAVIRRLAGDTVRVSVIEAPVISPPSPVPPALLQRIEGLSERFWPGLPVIPTMLAGATDGMYTRSAGIPTYGLSGMEEDPDDIRSHGKDERIRAEDFFRATQFWYELTKLAGDS